MNIIEGDRHDPLSATYQTIEVSRLNDTLKQCGIDDVELRRKICESYFFDSGYFLDSCWFQDEGHRYRAGVYFVKLDDQNQSSGELLLPDPEVGTMFHEYAHGASAWLFEDKSEDVSEIETGDINVDGQTAP